MWLLIKWLVPLNINIFVIKLTDALESETEHKRSDALQSIEDLIKVKYNISFEDFKIIETVVHKSEPHKAGLQWKFTGAFYYGIYCSQQGHKVYVNAFLLPFGSFDCSNNYRLWSFNSIDRRWKNVHNVSLITIWNCNNF